MLLVVAVVLAAFVTRARGTSADAQTPPDTFDPEVARVAPGSALATSREALRRGDATAARDAATAALATATGDDAVSLRFVQARALAASGDVPGAAAAFADVASHGAHPLSRWAHLLHAEAVETTDAAAALAEAQALADAWPGRSRAQAVVARTLAGAGHEAEAVTLLRALVVATPDRVGAASVALPLAELLVARGDEASKEEALALYRRVATRAPLADEGRTAVTRAAALLATLAADRRAALAFEPVDDALVRAQAMLDSAHPQDAETAFRAALSRDDATAAQRCDARRGAAMALLRRRQRAQGATELVDVAHDCTGDDLRASALFEAGKARAGSDAPGAIAAFDLLARELPSHRFADDALVRAAIAARDSGDADGMRTRLRTLLDTMPEGDLRPDAHFLLAWQARAAGDHAAALAELDRAVVDPVAESGEDLHGRARYWRARALEAVGRAADAKAAYVALAREQPLAYYAQAALARLAALDAPAADAVRTSWTATGPLPALRFPRRAETGAPGLARAVALLRVSEPELATLELAALGLVGEGADPDALWLAAALYDRGGAYASSVVLVRKRLTSFRAVPPVGAARSLWRIAYPQAYAPLVEDAATAEHVPVALLRAIAREESGFDPTVRSSAGAIGLVQLLPGTAARFGHPLGLPSDVASLRRPEVALRTGARFLSMLLTQNAGREALVPAAYNAGEGALARFLAARPADDLPAFVEDIPYDETRRYTRRVVQSWGVYAALDGTAPPKL